MKTGKYSVANAMQLENVEIGYMLLVNSENAITTHAPLSYTEESIKQVAQKVEALRGSLDYRQGSWGIPVELIEENLDRTDKQYTNPTTNVRTTIKPGQTFKKTYNSYEQYQRERVPYLQSLMSAKISGQITRKLLDAFKGETSGGEAAIKAFEGKSGFYQRESAEFLRTDAFKRHSEFYKTIKYSGGPWH